MRSRPTSLLDFRDRALLSVCYEAACPIEKLLAVSIGDNGTIVAAKIGGSARKLTCRNVVHVDGKPHILFESSAKRLFVWLKKLRASGCLFGADAKMFPALHSNRYDVFDRCIGRTTAAAIFDKYFSDTGIKALGFSGLRRAGIARQLAWGLHPKAVFALSGYGHIRSIYGIADEYDLQIKTDEGNPFQEISPHSYVLNAQGFSTRIASRLM
ncbi:hypothetical protein [Pseudaestuariivita rosea]|uniref:hypothetical protein n=1 Tax=Pseudaestuariivita rosea TaxID=2763263 RepID=UPI001ABA7285|nr:hypothetical protein [Pseudaestuariivita rosea]